MFDREPRLRLLNVENAAKRLFERNILTRDVFDSASDTAKRQAFTIAGDLGAETIDRFRGWLYRIARSHERARIETKYRLASQWLSP